MAAIQISTILDGCENLGQRMLRNRSRTPSINADIDATHLLHAVLENRMDGDFVPKAGVPHWESPDAEHLQT
jgi:hypothetical protein